MTIKEYTEYKLHRFVEGDKGALGDLNEVCVKSMLYKNFTDELVYVSAQGKADFYSREGSYEIGHNGKSWFFRDEYNRKRYPRKVIYGMLSMSDFQAIAEAILNDNLQAAQVIVSCHTAIFNSEDEYIEAIENLTRGKGLKVVHTADRGDLTMTVYNESKYKAFTKAIEAGIFTKFEGRV